MVQILVLAVFLVAGSPYDAASGAPPAREGLQRKASAKDPKKAKEPQKDKNTQKAKDAKKSKKDNKKKYDEPAAEAGKGKAAEPAEWKHAGSPVSDFLFLAREMPDFSRLPADADKITVSTVALRDGGLLFLEGCTADKKKHGWTVTGGKSVRIEEGTFLAKLVAGGTETSPEPDSGAKLDELMSKVRKTRKAEELAELFMPSVLSSRKGLKADDDLLLDRKACGESRYLAAVSSLPSFSYAGAHVVVLDFSYVVDKAGASYKVQTSLARTKDGWRLGSLRVRCY